MPVCGRNHLAQKLRQNWMSKYPTDTFNNGAANLDESLTSLNWLQNLKILKIPNPTPPPSPGVDVKYLKDLTGGDVLRVVHEPPKMTNAVQSSSQDYEPVDYKTNPLIKPPFSYAALICMAMKESRSNKMTLSAIYNWITENFMYYRMADPSWQNSIRHNLSLNKCFQKVPRRKDEPGKGGFWRVNPEYIDMIDNGILKKRKNGRDTMYLPLKRVMKENIRNGPDSHQHYRGKGGQPSTFSDVLHVSSSDDCIADFNWNSILNQDIVVGGVKVKTETIIDETDFNNGSFTALSPPSSDSNFSMEDILCRGEFSSNSPVDFTTNDPLDLTIKGTSIKPPEWWNESVNGTGEGKYLLDLSGSYHSGLNTPTPVPGVHHPWAETKSDLDDIAAAFDIDSYLI